MNRAFYTGGTIACLSEIRKKPQAAASIIPAHPKVIALEPITVPVLVMAGNQKPTLCDFNLSLSYLISRFYPVEAQEDSRPDNLMACAAALIANTLNIGALSDWRPVVRAFEVEGIKLTLKSVGKDWFVEKATSDNRFMSFLGLFGDDFEAFLERSKGPFIITCILLIMMTKSLNPDNYKGWIKNRIRGFSGTFGDTESISLLSESTYAPLSILSSYQTRISSSFDVRRQLFLTILAAANDPNHGFIQKGYNEVINFMRGAEMNHIILIDQFILQKYKELRYLHCMNGLEDTMTGAIQYLASLPPDEMMYARILYSKDETVMLNRNRFNTYSTVAIAAAQFESSTYDNYFISEHASQVQLARLVKGYLAHRARLLSISAGEKKEARMQPIESEQFFKVAVEKYEKETSEMEEAPGSSIMRAQFTEFAIKP